MRKALFLLTILILVFFVLTGCSQPSTTPSPPAAIKSTPATSSPAAVSSAAASTARTPVHGGTFRYMTTSGPGGPFGVPWNSIGGNTFSMQFSLQTLVREMLDTSMQLSLAESY